MSQWLSRLLTVKGLFSIIPGNFKVLGKELTLTQLRIRFFRRYADVCIAPAIVEGKQRALGGETRSSAHAKFQFKQDLEFVPHQSNQMKILYNKHSRIYCEVDNCFRTCVFSTDEV